MHPADVTDLVQGQYRRLRDRLPELSEFGVGDLTIEEDHRIYLELSHTDYKTATHAIPVGLHAPNGLSMVTHNWNVPVLGSGSSRSFVLEIDAEQYNLRPPQVELLNDGRQRMPLADWPAGRSRRGIVEEHPNLDRPLFCRPGTYGYHTHPAHADDPWAKHREGLSLEEFIVTLVVDLHNDYTSRR